MSYSDITQPQFSYDLGNISDHFPNWLFFFFERNSSSLSGITQAAIYCRQWFNFEILLSCCYHLCKSVAGFHPTILTSLLVYWRLGTFQMVDGGETSTPDQMMSLSALPTNSVMTPGNLICWVFFRYSTSVGAGESHLAGCSGHCESFPLASWFSAYKVWVNSRSSGQQFCELGDDLIFGICKKRLLCFFPFGSWVYRVDVTSTGGRWSNRWKVSKPGLKFWGQHGGGRPVRGESQVFSHNRQVG